MANLYSEMLIETESDVEQKFVYSLLTELPPNGLGYSDFDIRTKIDIRKLTIDKGNNKKLYYPDYAVIVDGFPVLIIEAKKPGSDLEVASREARLYAAEINSKYKNKINPCSVIVVTDGVSLSASHWDESTPSIELPVSAIDPLSPEFNDLIELVSKETMREKALSIANSIRHGARYVKPVFMLGGESVKNETVGENSFGANISLEYKYLFNPDTRKDREAIVINAYVKSKRKQSHVSPIDRIIRAALPANVIDARLIDDTGVPREIFDAIKDVDRIRNELCLLVGSVGSGKSTFSDYLRVVALPVELKESTEWVNVNLNKAPVSREHIYDWILEQCILKIRKANPSIDFDDIETLKGVYARELSKLKKGRASLYQKDSEKYIDLIVDELGILQSDKEKTLDALINYLYCSRRKFLVIVLDNCDKRVRDDQLLMFEVATWLKNRFTCMLFLYPL